MSWRCRARSSRSASSRARRRSSCRSRPTCRRAVLLGLFTFVRLVETSRSRACIAWPASPAFAASTAASGPTRRASFRANTAAARGDVTLGEKVRERGPIRRRRRFSLTISTSVPRRSIEADRRCCERKRRLVRRRRSHSRTALAQRLALGRAMQRRIAEEQRPGRSTLGDDAFDLPAHALAVLHDDGRSARRA